MTLPAILTLAIIDAGTMAYINEDLCCPDEAEEAVIDEATATGADGVAAPLSASQFRFTAFLVTILIPQSGFLSRQTSSSCLGVFTKASTTGAGAGVLTPTSNFTHGGWLGGGGT